MGLFRNLTSFRIISAIKIFGEKKGIYCTITLLLAVFGPRFLRHKKMLDLLDEAAWFLLNLLLGFIERTNQKNVFFLYFLKDDKWSLLMSQKMALSKIKLNRTGKSLKKFTVQAQNQAACQIALQWHGVTKHSIYVWKKFYTCNHHLAWKQKSSIV